MKQCPSCGRKCYNGEKYCPVCNYYLGNVKEESNHNIKQTCNTITVSCPYCQQTNTTKISTTSKVVNTAIWGIFGTKRHKEWHCNNCNSDF